MLVPRPWLWLPSQLAHDIAPKVLPLAAAFSRKTKDVRPLHWRGLSFRNPIGLAGGADKSGVSLLAWQKLGAGFLEVGTITPKPQAQNPGTVMARDTANDTLWNKMGFPSPGCLYALTHLQKMRSQIHVPLFINIGKNRTTPNEKAADDYIYCLEHLDEMADAFVVNISSPNTSGLRDLLQPSALTEFLKPIIKSRDRLTKKTPLFLKLSPDMDDDQLRTCLDISSDLGIDGWIVTNTTLDRSIAKQFPPEGGVSGLALTARSREFLQKTIQFLGHKKGDKLVISVGGISSADEVRTRLELGADLVQVYSALVFQGPYFFKKTLKKLAK